VVVWEVNGHIADKQQQIAYCIARLPTEETVRCRESRT